MLNCTPLSPRLILTKNTQVIIVTNNCIQCIFPIEIFQSPHRNFNKFNMSAKWCLIVDRVSHTVNFRNHQWMFIGYFIDYSQIHLLQINLKLNFDWFYNILYQYSNWFSGPGHLTLVLIDYRQIRGIVTCGTHWLTTIRKLPLELPTSQMCLEITSKLSLKLLWH